MLRVALKIVKTLFLIIFSIVVIFIALIIIFEEPYTTPEKIKKEFRNNFETILEITEFMENSSYSNISIYAVDFEDEDLYGHWRVPSAGSIPIENDTMVNKLHMLFVEKKYQLIRKDETKIYFQLWANLDAGRGVVYSIDGSEPMLQYLTKLEELDEENWYYYETDVNEWRRQNEVK